MLAGVLFLPVNMCSDLLHIPSVKVRKPLRGRPLMIWGGFRKLRKNKFIFEFSSAPPPRSLMVDP